MFLDGTDCLCFALQVIQHSFMYYRLISGKSFFNSRLVVHKKAILNILLGSKQKGIFFYELTLWRKKFRMFTT